MKKVVTFIVLSMLVCSCYVEGIKPNRNCYISDCYIPGRYNLQKLKFDGNCSSDISNTCNNSRVRLDLSGLYNMPCQRINNEPQSNIKFNLPRPDANMHFFSHNSPSEKAKGREVFTYATNCSLNDLCKLFEDPNTEHYGFGYNSERKMYNIIVSKIPNKLDCALYSRRHFICYFQSKLLFSVGGTTFPFSGIYDAKEVPCYIRDKKEQARIQKLLDNERSSLENFLKSVK